METIEAINKRLEDVYGKDTVTGRAIWRVVWSNDEMEKQFLSFTPDGVELIYPQWFEVPKYKMIGIEDTYILERLVLVPDISAGDITVRMSYEPMWPFRDRNGFPLPPKWEVCEFVIYNVYQRLGKPAPVYKDPDASSSTEEHLAKENVRLVKLMEDLFGNETNTGDALAYREGVSVPNNYERKQ